MPVDYYACLFPQRTQNRRMLAWNRSKNHNKIHKRKSAIVQISLSAKCLFDHPSFSLWPQYESRESEEEKNRFFLRKVSGRFCGVCVQRILQQNICVKAVYVFVWREPFPKCCDWWRSCFRAIAVILLLLQSLLHNFSFEGIKKVSSSEFAMRRLLTKKQFFLIVFVIIILCEFKFFVWEQCINFDFLSQIRSHWEHSDTINYKRFTQTYFFKWCCKELIRERV